MKKSRPPKKMSIQERMKRAITDSKAIQGEFYTPKVFNEWSEGILEEIRKERKEKKDS